MDYVSRWKRHLEFCRNSVELHNLNLKGEATVDKHVWGENARYPDADNEKFKRK